ncbi:MAG: ABC transporter permease [Lachnotalea sp.]
MREFGALVKRNMMIYYKDRSNVFFSVLSMLIVIGLMAVFLGSMNVDSITKLLNEYGGVRDEALDSSNASNLVLAWIVAGLVVVNSVTVTLAVVGMMIEDEAKHRLNCFFVSPMSRTKFVFSYVSAAFIMGFTFCCFTIIISEVYIAISGGVLLNGIQLVTILLYVVVIVFFASSFVFFIAIFVHSQSAFSGLLTIVGTLVGFVAAIYVPLGALPVGVIKALKYFPLLSATSLLREIFTKYELNTTFSGVPTEVIDGYKEYMGITLVYDDKPSSVFLRLTILVISGIILVSISAIILRKRNVKDR